VDELKQQLTKKDTEIKQLQQQHLLDLAEMENVRMRARRDIDNEKSFALTGFAKQLLDVADNLGRAIESATKLPAAELEGNVALKAMLEGVQMTQSQLTKTFEKHGIVKVRCRELFASGTSITRVSPIHSTCSLQTFVPSHPFFPSLIYSWRRWARSSIQTITRLLSKSPMEQKRLVP
jgi:hypothetical protein